MPIYEYKCQGCGLTSEFLETGSRPGSRVCPHCGGRRLKKQFSVFSPRVVEGASRKCFGCSDRACPHAGAGLED